MRIPVALYALALIVRAILVALYPHAAYPDSYYYADVAQSLGAGHGFSIDFIWNFVDVGGALPAHPGLPIPSNAHWMPLPSLVQLPALWLLDSNGVAAAIPFALLGALAAPLAWVVARDAGAEHRVALGTGIMVAIPAATAIYMTQPDGFALYQPLALLTLWLTARGLKGDGRAFAFAGLGAGLASLTRNDGTLLAAVIALAFVWSRWRAWRADRAGVAVAARRPMLPWWAAVASAALFLAVMAPWYARQLSVFGSFSPSATSGRILFITDYAQLFSVGPNDTLATFLGQGLGPLLTSRVLGLVSAVSIFSVLVCPTILVPFAVLGGWVRRRSVDFGPFFAYATLLFAASGLLFAVHVPYGTFLHSAVALAPHTYLLALEGVVLAVRWVARRRRSWREARASTVFVGAAVGTAGLTAVAFAVIALSAWSHEAGLRQDAARALDRAGAAASDRLMTADPGGYEYWTGRGGVVTPDDPLGTIERVAEAYDVRWLVLERDHVVGALAPVLEGEARPAWIGAPVLAVPHSDGGAVSGGGTQAAGGTPAGNAPDLAVYPVCWRVSDTRCAATADRR